MKLQQLTPAKVLDKVLREAGVRQRPYLFNEAVSFDHECIFVAIPKTGTSTVRAKLKREADFLFPEGHLNIVQIRRGLYSYFLKLALGTNTQFPTQNVPSDADLFAKVDDVFDRFFKFSAVRNPWARTASLYARTQGLQLRERMSFNEFCSLIEAASDTCSFPTFHRNQADWLIDESGEIAVDYTYKIEESDAAFAEIAERTGGRLQLGGTARQNVNPHSQAAKYRELYDDETRKRIGKLFEKDIDLFGYTF